VASDRAEIARARFQRAARERVRELVTDALIAEHAARPLGPHSDDLARVLTFLRGAPVEGKQVLMTIESDRAWQIGRITRADRARPLILEGDVYTSCDEALHAIFLDRVEALRRSDTSTEADG
jgi:branched-chain amino acid transport system permease protein